VKYLDYKAGKKQVKAVARAVNRVNATPRTPADQRPSLPRHHSLYGSTSPFAARTKPPPLRRFNGGHDGATESLHQSPAALGADSRPESDDSAGSADDPGKPQIKKTPPMLIHGAKRPSGGPADGDMKYGSFVPTPPKMNTSPFKLPDPALSEDTLTALPNPTLPHLMSRGDISPRQARPNLESLQFPRMRMKSDLLSHQFTEMAHSRVFATELTRRENAPLFVECSLLELL
jgi:hypothetical protein